MTGRARGGSWCWPRPPGRALTRTPLAEVGLPCHVCPGLPGLCREFGEGVGVVLLTEEVLADGEADRLSDVLHRQPPQSDVPVLLLSTSGADSPVAA